ncbi:MAG: hypothetical protein ACM3WU_06070 [Bacillota bacterium]
MIRNGIQIAPPGGADTADDTYRTDDTKGAEGICSADAADGTGTCAADAMDGTCATDAADVSAGAAQEAPPKPNHLVGISAPAVPSMLSPRPGDTPA